MSHKWYGSGVYQKVVKKGRNRTFAPSQPREEKTLPSSRKLMIPVFSETYPNTRTTLSSTAHPSIFPGIFQNKLPPSIIVLLLESPLFYIQGCTRPTNQHSPPINYVLMSSIQLLNQTLHKAVAKTMMILFDLEILLKRLNEAIEGEISYIGKRGGWKNTKQLVISLCVER